MRAREFVKESEDINKQLEKHYWGKYNPTDREMLGRYVQDNSMLNGILYSKEAEKHLKDPTLTYHTDAIKHLDTLAQQHTTPFDMTVHRGLRTAPELGKDNVMTSPGFLSTSVDPKFADWWSGKQALGRQQQIQRSPGAYTSMTNPEYKHVMQIQVPKGVPGFYASDLQAEWVAPRGSQVKVNPTPTIDHKTKTVSWQGQYLPTEPKPAAAAPTVKTTAATTPRTAPKSLKGAGGGYTGGMHGVPDDLAAAYQLNNPMLGSEFDYVPNLMRAEREARSRKK